MKIGETTRTVVSSGTFHGRKTQEVIYKTAIGKYKGKMLFSSKTRHERV